MPLQDTRENGASLHTYVGLLRAVNVGGTGKLAMQDLVRMCVDLGFSNVKTYIASGNVIFQSHLTAPQCRKQLEHVLHDYAGKPVGVFIRTPAELSSLLKNNPFADQAGNRVVGIFLDAAPDAQCLQTVKGLKDEQIELGSEHLYVFYGEGMASSKLVIPAAKTGTARNINTITKLVELSRAL